MDHYVRWRHSLDELQNHDFDRRATLQNSRGEDLYTGRDYRRSSREDACRMNIVCSLPPLQSRETRKGAEQLVAPNVPITKALKRDKGDKYACLQYFLVPAKIRILRIPMVLIHTRNNVIVPMLFKRLARLDAWTCRRRCPKQPFNLPDVLPHEGRLHVATANRRLAVLQMVQSLNRSTTIQVNCNIHPLHLRLGAGEACPVCQRGFYFHDTDTETAKKIERFGFDKRFSTSLYGDMLYFAPDSCKHYSMRHLQKMLA